MRNPLALKTLAQFLLFSVARSNPILLERGTVISFDEESKTPLVLRNTSVLIVDDRITAIINSDNSNVSIPANTLRVPADNDIISPGFVDTHRHIWHTAYRTIGSDATITEFLLRWGSQGLSAQTWTPDDMYYSQLVGLCEAQNSGVTTIVDNGNSAFSEEIAEAERNASIESGIRIFWAYLVDGNYPDFPVEDQIRVYRRFVSDPVVAQSLLEMGLAYENFAGGSPELTQSVLDLAR